MYIRICLAGREYDASAAVYTWLATFHRIANDLSHHQRKNPGDQCRSRHPSAVGAARARRIDRNQVRMRHRAVRRLHGAYRRLCHALMLGAGEPGGRQADHDDRRARGERRPAQGPEGVDRARRAAVRILPVRHDHGGRGIAQGQAEADRRRHRFQHHQYLPLRHVPTGARGSPCRSRGVGERMTMNAITKINRRSFILATVAAGGGLALPFGGANVAHAADGTPEINAWVVIRPDDTVVIRIARAEMGQGSQTGLAQLIAEELDCDWSKVTTEIPTPGQNVARKRVWGNFNSSGSRAIRESNEYVRKGGAAARELLLQAAANAWGVPVSELTVAKGVITHKASNRSTTYGKVAEAAAKLEPPKEVKLKDPKDWTIAGKPLKRLDTADKVTGKQKYSMDFTLPGMLCAAVKECPVFGGKLKGFDAAKITNMPG